jgi:hypothetical protein
MGNTEWKRRSADREIDPTNNDKHLLDTGTRNPIIHKECERESQRIFEKVDLQLAFIN